MFSIKLGTFSGHDVFKHLFCLNFTLGLETPGSHAKDRVTLFFKVRLCVGSSAGCIIPTLSVWSPRLLSIH